MGQYFLPWLFAAIANLFAAGPNEFCDLGCNVHVMCENGKGVSHNEPYDCTNIGSAGLNEDQIKQIVNYHNTKRRYVASGNETRGRNGPQPAAEDMPDLEWDNELAALAQELANQCLKWNKYVCSHTKRFKVGQSISHHSDLKYHASLDTLLDQWYGEVNHFDAAKNVAHYKYDEGTRRYAQIVSSRTTKIGCGLVYAAWNSYYANAPKGKRMPLQRHSRLVCNYGPDGLVTGQPLYKSTLKPKVTNTHFEDKEPSDSVNENEHINPDFTVVTHKDKSDEDTDEPSNTDFKLIVHKNTN